MLRIFCVAAGGAVGALLRYAVSGLSLRYLPNVFPWGTFIVNLTGSLLIGLLWGLCEVVAVSQYLRLLLFVGVLGSFTTFSTFSLESFNLFRDGEYGFLFWNILLSVTLGICLVFAGYFSARSAINVFR